MTQALAEIDAGALVVAGAQAMLVELAAAADVDPDESDGTRLQ